MAQLQAFTAPGKEFRGANNETSRTSVRVLTLAVLLPVVAGCGDLYWQRSLLATASVQSQCAPQV